MLLIEKIYNYFFSGLDSKSEWQQWHKRTAEKIKGLCANCESLPNEIVDKTEKKYYSWLSVDLLREMQNNPQTILEIGGGSGALSFYLQKITGANCTIVDNSDIALEYAKLVFGVQKATFINNSAKNLSFANNEYDFVHSVGLIEHFSDNDVVLMIKEMVRVAKGNGYIFIAVPNYFSPDMIMIWRKYGKGTERYISVKKLCSLVSAYDVEVIKAGHCRFTFGAYMSHFLSENIESFIGGAGFGFLNYVLCRKNQKQ